MKIIKSQKYIKKEAIWSDPIGVEPINTEQEHIEPDEQDNIEGESEIEVNWQEFTPWYSEFGGNLPNIFLGRASPSAIKISYTYSYDYNSKTPRNIDIVKILDYQTNKIIKKSNENVYFMESVKEYYKDQILSDIEILEENDNLERENQNKYF